jgi:Uma2 family endonuclease
MSSPDQFHRLTLAQYRRLRELDILKPGEQVEFLEGFLVLRQPEPDGLAPRAILSRVSGQLPVDWAVHISHPLPLGGYSPESQPEPDLVIARRPVTCDSESQLAAKSVEIVIEMAGGFPTLERVDMARIYARASIPVYWVVNVIDKVIEVYTQPSGPGDSPAYAQRQDYAIGTAVPVILDGTTVGTIPVAEVMS